MVRYVPIEEILILIMCFRESYEFGLLKLQKLQPVPPSMPLKALMNPDNLTDSDSDGIDGGTGFKLNFTIEIAVWTAKATKIFT